MKRLEVYVPAGEAPVIRRAASVLRERTGEAVRLRQVLGFAREADGPPSAANIFAMPEAPSHVSERLWENAMAQIHRDRKDRRLGRLRKSPL